MPHLPVDPLPVNEYTYRPTEMTEAANALTRVGIVGLGGLNSKLFHRILASPEYLVHVYDEHVLVLEELVNLGAKAAPSPRLVAGSSHILICTPTDGKQLDNFLFDSMAGMTMTEKREKKKKK